MNEIVRPASDEPITGFSRIAKHENFVIGPNLEMVQQVRVITVDAEGVPLLDKINADTTLTPTRRQAALERYRDQLVNKQTEGAFVNAAGQVVEGTDEGAIPQLMMFQGITLGHLKAMGVPINDATSIASLIYILIGNEIHNIDLRGDL